MTTETVLSIPAFSFDLPNQDFAYSVCAFEYPYLIFGDEGGFITIWDFDLLAVSRARKIHQKPITTLELITVEENKKLIVSHGKDGKIFISNLDLHEMAAIDLQETSLCQLCILKASIINSSIPDSLFYIFVPNVFHLYRLDVLCLQWTDSNMSLRLHVSLCVEDCAQLESFGAIMNIRYISDRKIACAHESGYISLFHVNCTKFPESMTLDFIYSVACTKQPVLHLNCIPDREFIACSVSKSLCFLGFDEKTNKFSIKESLNLPYGGLCFSQYCGDVLVVGSWDGLVYFIDYKSRPSSLIDQSKWLFPNPIISIEEFFDPTGQIFDDESCKLAMISSKCGSVAIFKTRC